ncbi:MAG: class I SAM-dependent methyltransferase, partial [Nitrospirae bacterium]|nr:class I SAM-dependent methyltransferase [Nitrospirota bacterium]
ADPYDLYQKSVQSPDNDMNFLADYFKKYTGKALRHFREDFCGTAYLSSYFVTQHATNHALGVDLDWPTLNWGIKHNVSPLTPDQQQRISLVNANVLDIQQPSAQMIVALNFSYMIFHDRPTLLQYLTNAKDSLQSGGVLVLDIWGGSESQVLQEEQREIENSEDEDIGDFIFTWDQDTFDPFTHLYTTRMHFSFADGSELRNAFVYDWRLWTIPEVTELMTDAGFHDIHVLWEGTDPDTQEGTAIYDRTEKGDADLAWIAYIVGKNSH